MCHVLTCLSKFENLTFFNENKVLSCTYSKNFHFEILKKRCSFQYFFCKYIFLIYERAYSLFLFFWFCNSKSYLQCSINFVRALCNPLKFGTEHINWSNGRQQSLPRLYKKIELFHAQDCLVDQSITTFNGLTLQMKLTILWCGFLQPPACGEGLLWEP